jgi:hypothetical protein
MAVASTAQTDVIKLDETLELRHHDMISQLMHQLDGRQPMLPLHPHALTVIARKCEGLAAEARATADAADDSKQSAVYYVYADRCDSVARQLHELAAKMTSNNGGDAD